MLKYIVKRILMLIPVLLGATFIVFTVMDMTPGDPAVSKLGVDATAEQIEELRESMGLNDPFLLRYGRFIWNLVQGDLGTSYKNDLDVMEQIMQRMPYTFLLSFAALLFAIIVGIPAGIISARRQYTVFDNCTMVLTLVGASAPHFWLGLMGVIVFAVKLGWLPAAYSASGSLALGIVLPMLTLGMNSTALVTRMTRSAMLDVMNQDYVDTARAKGVSEKNGHLPTYAAQCVDPDHHRAGVAVWLFARRRGYHGNDLRMARHRPLYCGIHLQQRHALRAGSGGHACDHRYGNQPFGGYHLCICRSAD